MPFVTERPTPLFPAARSITLVVWSSPPPPPEQLFPKDDLILLCMINLTNDQDHSRTILSLALSLGAPE